MSKTPPGSTHGDRTLDNRSLSDESVELQAQQNGWLRRAETLHSLFIEECIEAADFCPWARGARLAGRSRVVAIWQDKLDSFLRTGAAEPQIEVWQIVVPDATERAMAWREQVATIERSLRREGVELPWAFAAFHPQHPGRPESLGGTIGMLRRSPLPALQLIRLDVLDRVREHAAGTVDALAEKNRETLAAWLEDLALVKKHAGWLEAGNALRQDFCLRSRGELEKACFSS